MKTDTYPITVRFVEPQDIDAVLAIDRDGRPAKKWQRGEFESFLSGCGHALVVAEQNNKVAGFLAYAVNVSKLHTTLVKVVVSRCKRHMGVGRSLVEFVLHRAGKIPGAKVTALVRESDERGCLFFKRVGFEKTTLARGAFRDTGEDGYLFCQQTEDIPL